MYTLNKSPQNNTTLRIVNVHRWIPEEYVLSGWIFYTSVSLWTEYLWPLFELDHTLFKAILRVLVDRVGAQIAQNKFDCLIDLNAGKQLDEMLIQRSYRFRFVGVTEHDSLGNLNDQMIVIFRDEETTPIRVEKLRFGDSL